MQAAMGDAISNVSQELRELDSLIETAQRNFNDKVKDVSGLSFIDLVAPTALTLDSRYRPGSALSFGAGIGTLRLWTPKH